MLHIIRRKDSIPHQVRKSTTNMDLEAKLKLFDFPDKVEEEDGSGVAPNRGTP